MKDLQVNSFDVYKAEEELKKCPTIIKTYVKLLKKDIERKQQFNNELIKKIKEDAK